jgi:hypothetical protein
MHEEDEPDDGPVDGGDIWASYHRAHRIGPVSWQMVVFPLPFILLEVGALILAHYLGAATIGLAVMGLIMRPC